MSKNIYEIEAMTYEQAMEIAAMDKGAEVIQIKEQMPLNILFLFLRTENRFIMPMNMNCIIVILSNQLDLMGLNNITLQG